LRVRKHVHFYRSLCWERLHWVVIFIDDNRDTRKLFREKVRKRVSKPTLRMPALQNRNIGLPKLSHSHFVAFPFCKSLIVAAC
jgi:hypothetical protein